MRPTRHIFLAVISFVLCLSITQVDAVRGSRENMDSLRLEDRPRRERRERRERALNLASGFYDGLVIVPAGDGSYFAGYPNQCPHKCAVDGACATELQCEAKPWSFLKGTAWIFYGILFVGGIIAWLVMLILGIKGK